jgi:hypothetical protein
MPIALPHSAILHRVKIALHQSGGGGGFPEYPFDALQHHRVMGDVREGVTLTS